jgi:ribosomal protein L37AE/L43A
MKRKKVNDCIQCGDEVAPQRYALGIYVCLSCGEKNALSERKSWCIAPMHKSNYMRITDKNDLIGLNNKGGLVK